MARFEADREALHVKLADEAYCSVPRLRESYLNMTNLIIVALSTGVDGIHPGYGFIVENVDFASCAPKMASVAGLFIV